MPYSFAGHALPFNGRYILAYGPEAEALGVPMLSAPVFLRPAYRSLWPPHEFILPEQIIDDYGQRFQPPQSYEWLEERGDLFPRSEVIGLTQSGEKTERVIKTLDLVDVAVFAGRQPDDDLWLKVDLAIEAKAVPDNYALLPIPFPILLLDRALPCYRLAPGVFGAVGAAIIGQLLIGQRTQWRLTYDEVDEMLGG